MRTQGNIALKTTVTNQEIENVIRLRRIYDTQKKRLELIENELVQVENSIMVRVQAGAPVASPREIQVKAIERRNVAWKGIVCELIGSERTEQILNQTQPSITYRLLIKEAA